MQLLFLGLFALGLFSLLTFLRRWADSFIMIAFAIGCICCANIYNASNVGFEVAKMTFAIDSVLYTMFLYTVAVKSLHYSTKDSRLFIYSSIVAIVISALIEFFANTIAHGYDVIYLNKLLAFFASALATLAATFAMRVVLRFFIKLGWNAYAALPIAIIVGSLINGGIYYGLSFFIYGDSVFNNILGVIGGNFIAKAFSVLLGEVGYLVNGTIWPVRELQIKNDSKGIAE